MTISLKLITVDLISISSLLRTVSIEIIKKMVENAFSKKAKLKNFWKEII